MFRKKAGTGNSLYAARRLDEECISIPQVMDRTDLQFQADRIGIVCPVYGHEMPQMVKAFISRAELQTAVDKHVDEQLSAIRADILEKKREIEPVTDEDRKAHAGYLERVGHQPEKI